VECGLEQRRTDSSLHSRCAQDGGEGERVKKMASSCMRRAARNNGRGIAPAALDVCSSGIPPLTGANLSQVGAWC
jgi:hypothetical protein